MISTTELAESPPMPQCRYSLHLDNPEGPEVQFARVGDKVVHRWDCITGKSVTHVGKSEFSC